MNNETIEQLIIKHIPDAKVELAGDGCQMHATIISNAFVNQSLVKRQQLVYASLGTVIADGHIHALSLKTLTPEEVAMQQKQRPQHG